MKMSYFVPALLVLAGARVSFAVDLKSAVVEKGIQYIQTSAGQPIPDDNNGASFTADVKATSKQVITNATMKLPNGLAEALPPTASDEFQFKKKYNKQSTLDANFPNGTYALTVDGVNDGSRTYALSLTGDIYPNAPHVADFAATQAVDAGAYFRCNWDAFDTGGTGDFVQLHLDDSQGNKVWETSDLGEPGALDGAARGALIPANTLTAGQVYPATLTFAKLTARDETTYPGALGAALYFKRTKFTIATALIPTQSAVKRYSLAKTRRYDQPKSGAPVAASVKPFTFDAVVETTSTGAVKSVTMMLPSSSTQDLSPADSKTFSFSADASLQVGLDATYPNGQYTFQIATGSKTESAPLNLLGNSYPEVPQVQNLPASADAAADLVLTWNSFSSGTSDDFVQLHIEDDKANKVFETPDFRKSGALNGHALSATIPRNSLLPGQTYSGRVIFQKNVVLDSTTYLGALGVAAYAARTNFKLVTGGGNLTPPQFLQPVLTEGGGIQLRIQGQPGQSLRVETTSDLEQWTLLQSGTVPSTGILVVNDNSATTGGTRLYRALVAP